MRFTFTNIIILHLTLRFDTKNIDNYLLILQTTPKNYKKFNNPNLPE